MTGNYIYTGEYLKIVEYLVHDMSGGELSADMVQNVRITPDGTVFEVFYLDREGHKICLPDGKNNWYCPTYHHRVNYVDALAAW